jgi:hypothetical protein
LHLPVIVTGVLTLFNPPSLLLCGSPGARGRYPWRCAKGHQLVQRWATFETREPLMPCLLEIGIGPRHRELRHWIRYECTRRTQWRPCAGGFVSLRANGRVGLYTYPDRHYQVIVANVSAGYDCARMYRNARRSSEFEAESNRSSLKSSGVPIVQRKRQVAVERFRSRPRLRESVGAAEKGRNRD